MARQLHLTMACGLYDRMLDLYRGDVRPAGIELNFIPLDGSAGAREIFDRMATRIVPWPMMSSSKAQPRTADLSVRSTPLCSTPPSLRLA